MNKYGLILFDLDGTLIDTSAGIFNSVRYVEEKMGFNSIDNELLKQFVGPPPKQKYMEIYGVDEETALQATSFHREYGRNKAMYESKVYDGIIECLEYLKNNDYKLGVCTLKSQKIADDVLKIHKLYDYFDIVVGMDECETLKKCDTIEIAMQNISHYGEVILIGDSEYDYIGALEANIDFIGALYGFGFDFDKSNNYKFETVNCPIEIMKALQSKT